MPIETYILTIDRPKNCNSGLTKQYIYDAINSMKGCYMPEDERMGLECLEIKKERKHV